MQNLFFSTGEGDTIAQDSRCKSSLSEAATFWLASSGCPFASARLRNILSRTVFKNVIICSECCLFDQGFGLGFPTGQDSATFWDNGTEVSSLSRDKGTTGQAKNLANGRDGPGQPKFGTGRAGTA